MLPESRRTLYYFALPKHVTRDEKKSVHSGMCTERIYLFKLYNLIVTTHHNLNSPSYDKIVKESIRPRKEDSHDLSPRTERRPEVNQKLS